MAECYGVDFMHTKNRLCLRTFKQSVIVRFSFFILKTSALAFFCCLGIFVVHLKLFIEKNGRRLREITRNVCALKQGREVGNIKTGFTVATHFMVFILEL